MSAYRFQCRLARMVTLAIAAAGLGYLGGRGYLAVRSRPLTTHRQLASALEAMSHDNADWPGSVTNVFTGEVVAWDSVRPVPGELLTAHRHHNLWARNAMRSRIHSLCRLALVLVLLGGPVLKMAQPEALTNFLGWLLSSGGTPARFLTHLVALGEAGIALAILIPRSRPAGQAAATVLFGIYFLLGVFARLAGVTRPCGCFGSLPFSVGEIPHIAVTGVLFGCGLYLISTDSKLDEWLRKPRTLLGLAVVLVAVLAFDAMLFSRLLHRPNGTEGGVRAGAAATYSALGVQSVAAFPTKRIGPENDPRLGVPGLEHAMEVVGDSLLIIADPWKHRVLVVDTSGSLRSLFGAEGKGPAEFQSPWSVDFDPAVQRICIGDPFLARVSWFTLSGKYVGSFQVVGGLGKDVAVDGRGRVYVADTSFGHLVAVYTREGKLLRRFGEHLREPNVPLLSPAEAQAVTLDVDAGGNCYVAFAFHPEPVVRKYRPDGSLAWSIPFVVPEVTDGIRRHYAYVKGSPAMPIERLRVCNSKVYAATAIIPALYELDSADGKILRKIRLRDTPLDASFGPVKLTFSGFAMDSRCRLWRACYDIVRFEFSQAAP